METFRPLPVFTRSTPDVIEPANKRARYEADMPDLSTNTMFVRNSGMNHVITTLLAKRFDRDYSPSHIGGGDLVYRLGLKDDDRGGKQFGFELPTNKLLNHQQLNAFFRRGRQDAEDEVARMYNILNKGPAYLQALDPNASIYKQIVRCAYEALFAAPMEDGEDIEVTFRRNRENYLDRVRTIVNAGDQYGGYRWIHAFPEFAKTEIDLVGVCYNASKEPMPNTVDTHSISVVIEGEAQLRDVLGDVSTRVTPLVVMYRKRNYAAPLELAIVSRSCFLSEMEINRGMQTKFWHRNQPGTNIENLPIVGLFSTLGVINVPKDERLDGGFQNIYMMQNTVEQDLEKCMSVVRRQKYIRVAVRIKPFL